MLARRILTTIASTFEVKDKDGFKYEQPSLYFPDFLISSGTLGPGEKVRGVAPFEVKADAQGLVLEHSQFGDANTRVTVTLE